MRDGTNTHIGLYGVVLGAEAATSARDQVLRRTRRNDVSITIDSPNELGLVLSLSEEHRVERRIARRTDADVPRVGAVTLIPPGSPAHFRLTGPSRQLMLHMPWQRMAGWLGEDHAVDPDRIEVRPRLHADDPVLARLLYRAAADGEDAEAVGRAVASRLLAAHGPVDRAVDSVRGGLPPARLRRVLDRIEADLDGPLSLATLAAEAGLSPFHFARAFERELGTPPHRYLLRRRIARAVALLVDRSLPIHVIARGVGFSSASHLAHHMRRHTGLASEAFRARVLP